LVDEVYVIMQIYVHVLNFHQVDLQMLIHHSNHFVIDVHLVYIVVFQQLIVHIHSIVQKIYKIKMINKINFLFHSYLFEPFCKHSAIARRNVFSVSHTPRQTCRTLSNKQSPFFRFHNAYKRE